MQVDIVSELLLLPDFWWFDTLDAEKPSMTACVIKATIQINAVGNLVRCKF